MSGAGLIVAERQRQIVAEGWTPEHDAQHSGGDLVRAAECYLLAPRYDLLIRHAVPVVHGPAAGQPWAPHRWPWEPRYWKPCPDDRLRELVKAGALIAAEIDRLQALGDGA